MFYTPGLEQLDPALLAFVKCHVTSTLKWEALRVLAARGGTWVPAPQLARALHRHTHELASAMAEMAAEGLIDVARHGDPEEVAYCLPASEPTSVVAQRLIAEATHNQELRAVIAAYLQRSKHAAVPKTHLGATAVA